MNTTINILIRWRRASAAAFGTKVSFSSSINFSPDDQKTANDVGDVWPWPGVPYRNRIAFRLFPVSFQSSREWRSFAIMSFVSSAVIIRTWTRTTIWHRAFETARFVMPHADRPTSAIHRHRELDNQCSWLTPTTLNRHKIQQYNTYHNNG